MNIIKDKYLLFAAIIICSLGEGIRQILFNLPIVHLGNIICLYIFVKALIIQKPSRLIKRDLLPFTIWAAGYIFVGCIGAVIFKLDAVQFLWGCRTYLRMFLLLFDMVLVLEKEDLKLLYRVFNLVLVIHFALTLVQFFAFGQRWDYLNGIFGTQMGDSSSLHAILLIILCLVLYTFYTQTISWKLFLVHILWMSCNAALAEIRGWFYEIVILLIVYLILSHDFKRITKLLPALLIIYFACIFLMITIYPYTSEFLGIKGFSNIYGESHYAGQPLGIGRKQQMTAMTEPMLTYAKEKVGDKGILPIITGLGLGAAEYATVPFLKSEFFAAYEYLGYASFLWAFIYVETGILGFIEFNSMWLLLFIQGIYNWKNKKREALILILLAVVLADIAFYNQTLRSNYGYIVWVFWGAVLVLNNSDAVLHLRNGVPEK